ncbi:ROK family protein [Oryzifoliimicrobium ureilyticus]|uniref:ROK family protein n=1 Tax=Oryzifoliimicrobium ureilyticus TaxID=3113724 RepID=UPI0030767372
MSAGFCGIGVDIGGTNIRAAKISHDGAIVQKHAVAGSRSPDEALRIIKNLITALGADDVAAIGIGVPGRVDGWTGAVLSGGYLDLSKVDLKGEIERCFDLPTIVANDCSMALIGEARVGAAAGIRNVLMLTIGTGIGGAVLYDGRIVNGKKTAGQFGHIIVNHSAGKACLCGQKGCVETEASGTALGLHIKEAGYQADTRFEHVLAKARDGDRQAISVIHAWAVPLRAAIKSLSAAFDPELVLLGGGMGAAACQALEFLPAEPSWYDIDIRCASLQDDAGVIGAGFAALDLSAEKGSVLKEGKRLVMVNGVPASGKSLLARELSVRSGWPLLALDTIKNPFLELIDGVDRPFNRVLGRASYKAIFSTIGDAPPGSTFIVDAWFGFQPLEVLRDHIETAGVTKIAEVWCHAPPDLVGERYAARAAERLPGHPGLAYVPELVELARHAKPMAISPVMAIETNGDLNVTAVLDWVVEAFDKANRDQKAAVSLENADDEDLRDPA